MAETYQYYHGYIPGDIIAQLPNETEMGEETALLAYRKSAHVRGLTTNGDRGWKEAD